METAMHVHNGVLTKIPIRTEFPVSEPLGVAMELAEEAFGAG
jgi:hypothetical protein